MIRNLGDRIVILDVDSFTAAIVPVNHSASSQVGGLPPCAPLRLVLERGQEDDQRRLALPVYTIERGRLPVCAKRQCLIDCPATHRFHEQQQQTHKALGVAKLASRQIRQSIAYVRARRTLELKNK